MDAGVRSIVKLRTGSIVLTLGIVACAALSLAAQKKAAQPSGAVVFAQDKGKLPLKPRRPTVAHHEFEIPPSRGPPAAKATAETNPPHTSATTASGPLTLPPDAA